MWFAAAVHLLAFLFAAPPDGKAQLVDLTVSLKGREVELGFQLERGLSDPLFERIQTGLASGFTFDFVLFRDNKWWWDKELDSGTLEVVAMYNAVTREYLVNYKHDGRLVDSRVARDRDELERAMTRLEDLSAFTLAEDLNPARRLLVRARARLGSKNLLGVVPVRVRTPWVRSRKFRPPAE